MAVLEVSGENVNEERYQVNPLLREMAEGKPWPESAVAFGWSPPS